MVTGHNAHMTQNVLTRDAVGRRPSKGTFIALSLLAAVPVALTCLLGLNWRAIWGNFDLWIPPLMAGVQIAIYVVTLIAALTLRTSGKLRPWVPLTGLAIAVVANLLFFGIAWNDLPETAFE